MNLRELKLAIACGIETEEIKAVNNFFDKLFNSLTIYTKDNKPDLIFMKGDSVVMQQDLEYGILWCNYKYFWAILSNQYHFTHAEILEIVQYKVEEAFKLGSLTPNGLVNIEFGKVETAFKLGSLTPYKN